MLSAIFSTPENKDELYIYRFLLGIGGVAMIVFGYMFILVTPGAREIWYDRYFVSAVCFLGFAISFHPRFKQKFIFPVSEVVYGLFTLQALFANYLNNFALAYLFSLMLIVLAIASAFRERWKLRINLAAFMALLVITLAFGHPPELWYRAFIVIAFFFATLIIYITQVVRVNFQDKLEVSDELLRNVLNGTADAIFVTDIKGIIIDTNNRLPEMLQRKRDEVVGKQVSIIFEEPLSFEYMIAMAKEVIKSGMRQGIRKCRKGNGEIFWGNFAAVGLRMQHDDYILCRITDVSDQKRVENELKESEERYATAVAGANDGIWDWDLKTNWIYFSPRYKEMLGYFGDEDFPYNGHNWETLVLPEDRPHSLKALRDYLTGKSEIFSIEYRLRHKNGHYVWVSTRGKAIRDENGKAVRMAGSHTDITQRKEAENLLQSVMNSSQNGIMAYRSIRDGDGNIIDLEWTLANRSAADMLRRDLNDFIGTRLMERTVMRQEEATQLLNDYSNVINNRIPMNGERLVVYKDGKKAWYHIMAVPLEDGLAVTFIDVTSRKSYEEELKAAKEAAEAAGKAKSEFLATMSHEIRTPMNAVIGMTELLLETDMTTMQRDYVSIVRSSGDSLLSIINDILDYSKIDSGNIELEEQPFDLGECVESVYSMLTPKAREKKLELLCLIHSDIPERIVGDPIRLSQILVNLVNNAIKFTAKGEILVSVEVSSVVDEELELLFSVKDTGIGIPHDKIDKLFKLFSQVDSSTTRKYGGTGLGLVISKRLVNAMGGEMWVESTEGKGSTFYFTLPTEVAGDVAMPINDSSLLGKRVLLVDDNHTNLKILTLQCMSWGMETTIMDNALDALDLLQVSRNFDLAILDMQMPNMDGSQLVREIRKTFTIKELPIIILTSLASLPLPEERKLISAFVTKPARQSELLHHIRRALRDSAIMETPEKISTPTHSSIELKARKDISILVAEDNLINQKVAMGSLKVLGYDADVVVNGLEVIEELKKKKYDLVLMDVQMPEMDGIEATGLIRIAEKGKQHSLIVAMTANALKEDREKCLAAGMDDYIAKPVKLDTLRELLNKWFPV